MGAKVSEFCWPVRVYYEDVDGAGVVYYANYLRFLERARTEWLRDRGYEQDRLAREAGIVFAVRELWVDYRLPARFNDLLAVTARVTARRRASFTFTQEVRRDDEVLCRAQVRIACLDAATFRPCPLPPELYEELSLVH